LCHDRTINVALKVTAEQMDSYIDNTLAGANDDISSCLVLAIVNEESYDDPDDAYREENVTWRIASKIIAQIILNAQSSTATEFIRKLSLNVNSYGITKMKGLIGNCFEIIVMDFLLLGNFKKCRRLGEPGLFNVSLTALEECWKSPLKIQTSEHFYVSDALQDCTDNEILYCFIKTFPAIDYAAKGFQFVFQATNAGSYLIHLETIREVCKHVRITKGDAAKVRLIFVVPEENFSVTSLRFTQSFFYDKKTEIIGDNGERIVETKSVQGKYDKLDEEIKYELRNLEQWLCVVPSVN
jgi:hypothetical protein